MTVLGSRTDGDRRLLDYRDYDEYLDSLVTPVDIRYLRSSGTARQLAELGYRCTGETLSKQDFHRRSRIVKDILFPVQRPYVLTSEPVATPRGRLMEELALRERANRLGILATIIFIRHSTASSRSEQSAYVDFADRLAWDNWLPYYRGDTKLSPLARDLAYYHWRIGRTCLNETRNYVPIVDPERGLLFKNVHDRQLITVDPAAASPGIDTTRLRIRCPFYKHVILYDHVVRSKILQGDSTRR